MSFFKDMGIFEKVAFIVSLPVVGTAAVAVTAYESVTGKKVFSDSEPSSAPDEREVYERIERQAKERQAAEERKAIVDYAQKSLAALQAMHTNTVQPITISLSFPQLKSALRSSEAPLEILGRWVPQAPGSDIASLAHKEIDRLNEEINELRRLRQAILEHLPEEVSL